MNTKLPINNIYLTLGLAGLSLTKAHDVLKIEIPAFKVVSKHDDLEFRSYNAFKIAETQIDRTEDYNAAARLGFRRLFRYISGDNFSTEKIQMTAPVRQSSGYAKTSTKLDIPFSVQQKQVDKSWKISFVLPGKYTLASAPVPDDSRIRIREVPAQLIAALQYSGRWTKGNLQKHIQELHSGLAKMSINHGNDTISAVYNSPFSLPFLRRNEVLVTVESLPNQNTIT